MATLADLMNNYNAEREAEIAREEARNSTPEALARIADKKAAELERGIRLGWLDAEGNPIESSDGDSDEEE